MIFHDNHLLADDSHEILHLFFCWKLGNMLQNFSSVSVVVGTLSVESKFWVHKADYMYFLLRNQNIRYFVGTQKNCFMIFGWEKRYLKNLHE